MLVRMSKVRILGHRSALDEALRRLWRLGAVQLVDVVEAEPSLGLPPLGLDGARLRQLERLRLLRARIDGLLDLLPGGAAGGAAAAPAEVDFDAVASEVEALGPRVEELVGRLDELAAEAASLPRHVESLRRLLPLATELPELAGSEVVALLVERRQVRVLPALRAELEERVGRAIEIVSAPLDADTVGALVVFPRRHAAEVHQLLGREQVSRVRLPSRFEGLSFRGALAEMERRLEALPVEEQAAREALEDLLRPRQRWLALRAAVDARIAQLEAMRGLAGTPSSFVAVGWVPTDRLGEVRAALQDAPVALEVSAPEPGEEAPVALRNPRPARPFELFVNLLSPPRYGSLDPTVLMALFMPLFFGMMLGDVAYGVALLGIALWVGHRFGPRSPVVADMAAVLRPCALWTIVWGVVYGELLGDLGHRLGFMHPLWIDREHALEPLLAFAVAIGALHVTLGLVLGLFASGRRRDWRTLGKRAGLLVALLGVGGLLVAAAAGAPAGLGAVAVVALVVGLVVLVVLEGALGVLLGPLEVLGSLGHVLSYLRIAAIGLASVYLARVANELAVAGPLWAGLLVAALLHGLNLVLGVFSPTIQALRLHYVEFFRDFYEDGGVPFRPFGERPGTPPPPDTAAPADDDAAGRPPERQTAWTPPSSPSAPASP